MLESSRTSLLSFAILLLGFILAVSGQSDLTIEIGDKKFSINVDQKTNWFKASQTCSLLGMSLAAIENEREYTGLRTYLNNNYMLDAGFWLSGSNLADTSNAEYKWFSNGRRINYKQYVQGQPATDNAGLCIYTDSTFLWTTQACVPTAPTDNKYFICSKPLIPNCGITGRCTRSF